MRRMTLLLLLIVPMVLTAFFAVWQRNAMIQIGYETEALQQQKHRLLRHQKELIAEIASLSAAERIERIALEKLHMKSPAPGQRVYVASREQGEPKEE